MRADFFTFLSFAWIGAAAMAASPTVGVPRACPAAELQDPAPERKPSDRSESPSRATPEAQVQRQLAQCATLVDRTFELTWSWSQDRRSIQQQRAGSRIPPIRPGTASGSLHEDMLVVGAPSAAGIEMVQVGPQVIARRTGSDWGRVDRLELEQNGVAFTPDPRLLLRTLAECPFAVRDRSIGELDGRPVELVSLELPPESAGRLHRAGAIPDPNPVAPSLRAVLERYEVDARLIPPPVLDVAVAIDVESQRAVAVTVRALLVPIDTHAILQAAGGRTRGSNDDAAAIEALQQRLRGDGKQAFVYRAGLPERDAEGAELRLLTYRIGGVVERPQLDERQQQLLRKP